MKLIDTTHLWTSSQTYGITDTFVMDGEVVRVVIHVDAYAFQSYARADILSADKTWTPLCNRPSGDWHKDAPSYVQKDNALKESFVDILSAELADRAANIVFSVVHKKV